MISTGDMCTLIVSGVPYPQSCSLSLSKLMIQPIFGTGLPENCSPCSTVLLTPLCRLSSPPTALSFQALPPLWWQTKAEHGGPAVTLSILETMNGFLTKAIRASVFRARNSCTSSLLAISGMAQSCCKRHKKDFKEKFQSPDLYTLAWKSVGRM